jgi:DNA-binding Lrp family transcriptional regulator
MVQKVDELSKQQDGSALDEIDKRVLRVYQNDASISYKELGDLVSLPPSSVFDRVKRMRKAGIIKTIIPLLDMKSLSLNTTAWLFIDTDSDCDEVCEKLSKNPNVLEVHEIAGQYDILIKIKARNNSDYHEIAERISRIPGIRDTFSTISLRTVKEDIRPKI